MAKWMGSLQNTMMHNATTSVRKVEVGMGCTIISWTDRDAATVVEVVNDHKAYIRRDIAKRTDQNGMSESQAYGYIQDPKAEKELVTLRKDGRWHLGTTLRSQTVLMGTRRHYHDYSF